MQYAVCIVRTNIPMQLQQTKNDGHIERTWRIIAHEKKNSVVKGNPKNLGVN